MRLFGNVGSSSRINQAELFYYGKLTQLFARLAAANQDDETKLVLLQRMKSELLLAKQDLNFFSSLYRPIVRCLEAIESSEEQDMLGSFKKLITPSNSSTSSTSSNPSLSTTFHFAPHSRTSSSKTDETKLPENKAQTQFIKLNDSEAALKQANKYFSQLIALQPLKPQGNRKPNNAIVNADEHICKLYAAFSFHYQQAIEYEIDPSTQGNLQAAFAKQIRILYKKTVDNGIRIPQLERHLTNRKILILMDFFGMSDGRSNLSPSHRQRYTEQISKTHQRLRIYFKHYTKIKTQQSFASKLSTESTHQHLLRAAIQSLWHNFCRLHKNLYDSYPTGSKEHKQLKRNFLKEKKQLEHDYRQLTSGPQSPSMSDIKLKHGQKSYPTNPAQARKQIIDEIRIQRQYLAEIAQQYKMVKQRQSKDRPLITSCYQRYQTARIVFTELYQQLIASYPEEEQQVCQNELTTEIKRLNTQHFYTIAEKNWREIEDHYSKLLNQLKTQETKYETPDSMLDQKSTHTSQSALQQAYTEWCGRCQQHIRSITDDSFAKRLSEQFAAWQIELLPYFDRLQPKKRRRRLQKIKKKYYLFPLINT